MDLHSWVHRVLVCACLVAGPIVGPAGCGEGGPPAALEVASATDLGLLETNPWIRGRDGGYSAKVFGRSVWLYGDTVLTEPGADGSNWRNNSSSWTADLDPQEGITGFQEEVDALGGPVEFFPLTDEESRYNADHRGDPCRVEPCGARWALWPGALVEDPATGQALVFYSKVHAEPGDFNFYGVGTSVALWDAPEAPPVRPEVSPGAEHPTLLFPQDEAGFGSAAVVEQGWLYVYACQISGFDKPCRLARVDPAEVTRREAWNAWDGSGWSADLTAAQPIFEGNDILSVAWLPGPGLFLAVYSQPMDHEVMLRTAPRPEGPWSAPLQAFEARTPEGDPDGWIYDAQAHAEYALEGGRVQRVTYSRGTGFLQSEVRVVELTLR